MPTGYTYASFGTILAKMLAVNPGTTLTTNNTDLLNASIDYAELRIYRELDLLATQTESDSPALTPGTRTLAMPGGMIIVNDISVITPANTSSATGTVNPMQRTSPSFINYFWPTNSTQAQPQYWSLSTDNNQNVLITLAPTPDQAYQLHYVGVVRPASLYTQTSGTYLSLNLPDLFLAAAMVWATGGIQANFGAQADDPKAAMSWEQQYQTLKAGADVEALRQKSWGMTWTPYSPSPGSDQSRTG